MPPLWHLEPLGRWERGPDRSQAAAGPGRSDDIDSLRPTAEPLDRPVSRIKHGNQEWHRLEGEAEDSFRARAQAEAILQPGSSRLLMIME